jgi:hypothetical protein
MANKESRRLRELVRTIKQREQIERYKLRAKKLVEKLERAGIDPRFTERVRKDFGLPKVSENSGTYQPGKRSEKAKRKTSHRRPKRKG